MFNLYIKIAFRYLQKNKLYSFINIIGLAIGIASFIMIMIYVNYERSYDKFEGSENVYRVYMDALEGNSFVASDAQTANLIGPTLKQEFPEVKEYVRLYQFDKVIFKYNNTVFKETRGSLADDSYFDVFKYSLQKGTKETALKDVNTIVLTETLANKIFGNENPLKKTISAFHDGEEVLLTVTGILNVIPENTHIKTDFLISMKSHNNWFASEDEKKPNWSHCNFFTYIKTTKNNNYNQLKDKVITSDFGDFEDERHNIEPLESIHLYSNKPYEAEANGSITKIKFLTAIAFIILILSWLNYINLSTTKSLERAKEVGIRKVAGAQRGQLILQSVVESVILNAIAIVFALIINILLLAVYNKTTGSNLALNFETFRQLIPVFGIVVLGVLLASLYPAFLLSGYNPSKALKGKIRASANGLNIRKGLIITQFVATIILLIGTIIITKQINFLKDQPIGANLKQVLAFQGDVLEQKSDSLIRSEYRVLENEIRKIPGVTNVSRSQTFPGGGYNSFNSFIGITYPNGTEDNRTTFYGYATHGEYFNLLDIKFLSGNTFLENSTGRSRHIIINKTAMRELEIATPEEAVHKQVQFFGISWTISGVIEDYHHFDLKSKTLPIIILHQSSSNNLLVKFDKTVASISGYSSAISKVEKQWKQVFPQSTFNYTFLDSQFEAQYKNDKEFNSAFRLFTLLAILIASLGLFGLTSYTCIQRKKEIGIRKVNGASISEILSLLNIDFFKWIGISFLISIPVGWYVMTAWLENFALKTNLSWWVFALAGIITLGITFFTVSWQSFVAAKGNPVEALKDE